MFNPGESFGSSGWLAILQLFGCLLYGNDNLTVNNLQGSQVCHYCGRTFRIKSSFIAFCFLGKARGVPSEIFGGVFLLWGCLTGFGFVMFYRLIDRIGAGRAIMTTYLIPVFSILWGNIFLGESVTLTWLLVVF
ncbi:MAG: hypothetical protein Ct9H90mP27_7640 [Gammaproteobacteria bacterium]|nr:MAG: hypothetical protein Ct9H90mP27_7640 [Gammaproteobacteria bacterium]